MNQRKNGLNDSDKIFVTIALWIACIALFATSLTLPMLPDKVTIFYQPLASSVTDNGGEFYSKYNNLLLILTSLIPASIVLVTAFLKRRNRLQNNFMSIVLFSIMLSGDAYVPALARFGAPLLVCGGACVRRGGALERRRIRILGSRHRMHPHSVRVLLYPHLCCIYRAYRILDRLREKTKDGSGIGSRRKQIILNHIEAIEKAFPFTEGLLLCLIFQ